MTKWDRLCKQEGDICSLSKSRAAISEITLCSGEINKTAPFGLPFSLSSADSWVLTSLLCTCCTGRKYGGGGWQLTTVGFRSSKQQVTTCTRSSQVVGCDARTPLFIPLSSLLHHSCPAGCFTPHIPLLTRPLHSHLMFSTGFLMEPE